LIGKNESEMARKIIQHMESAHGMEAIPADFMIKIKYAIKDHSLEIPYNPGSEAQSLAAIIR